MNTKSWAAVGAISLAALIGFGCGKSEPESQASQEPAIETVPEALPSLQEQLDAKKAAFVERVPAEVAAAVDDGVAQVAASGVLESALREGDIAPDFQLPTACHDTVSLGGLLETGPVVIAWYRGGW